jgi:hypothetical protein
MATIKTVIAALLVLGSASLVPAHAAPDGWMNRASQTFSGGGY